MCYLAACPFASHETYLYTNVSVDDAGVGANVVFGPQIPGCFYSAINPLLFEVHARCTFICLTEVHPRQDEAKRQLRGG